MHRSLPRSLRAGEFEEENLTDDVADLEPEQVAAIKEWQTQFEGQYKYLGKLVGTQSLNRCLLQPCGFVR
jgi:hypothetical protein